MSRAVVIQAIINDSVLSAKGFDASSVRTNYDGEQRPSDHMFMVLRWGPLDLDPRILRGTKKLTIWVHMYREFSTDYVRIDNVIDRLESVLTDIIDVPGEDGFTLTLVEPDGASEDLKDDGYQTICRSVSFRVLSRKTQPRKVEV
jgi:hypothetical protein